MHFSVIGIHLLRFSPRNGVSWAEQRGFLSTSYAMSHGKWDHWQAQAQGLWSKHKASCTFFWGFFWQVLFHEV